ncbi:proline dehydrogenase family protein [Mycobacterium tuberculosis]|uniref:proline dehydrogenase family protein n=2 Tax=Mycobacteriaceae TaxID=1762 RepID=UPI0005EA4830|nr:proline dehydrogenase family protein [Mycobacterium tuberculosis]CFB40201.1 proline dehydrogenase [Mycobacterium tuberculosis]
MAGWFAHTLRPAMLAAGRSDRLGRIVERSPLTRGVVRRFVPGDTLDDVVDIVTALRDSGRYLSIDYLGENVTDADDAAAAVRAYLGLLDVLGRRGDIACDGVRPLEVSLKLSALGQALDRDGQKIALDNARAICERAERVGAWVTVDAEDHTTTDSTLSISGDLRVDFPWLGTVVQAYLRRTLADCAELAAVGARVRLCKGAYDEPASVAYRDAAQVTDSYLRCLRVLTAGRGYPMVATHDPVIIAAVPGITRESGRSQGDFEYQMLYGIEACSNGDLDTLLEVLDPGVAGEIDARKGVVVVGADRVGPTILRHWSHPATVLVAQPVCGQPAVLAFVNRALAGVLALSIEAGKITKIHVLVQPSTLDPLRAELGGG